MMVLKLSRARKVDDEIESLEGPDQSQRASHEVLLEDLLMQPLLGKTKIHLPPRYGNHHMYSIIC